MADTVIYEAHPAMFRAHPFWFIGAVILIPASALDPALTCNERICLSRHRVGPCQDAFSYMSSLSVTRERVCRVWITNRGAGDPNAEGWIRMTAPMNQKGCARNIAGCAS